MEPQHPVAISERQAAGLSRGKLQQHLGRVLLCLPLLRCSGRALPLPGSGFGVEAVQPLLGGYDPGGAELFHLYACNKNAG